MDALKWHSNRIIPGCQKRDEPMDTKKGTEFLRARRERFLGPKLLVCVCTIGTRSVKAIMATTVARINFGGWKVVNSAQTLLQETFLRRLAVSQVNVALVRRHKIPHGTIWDPTYPTPKGFSRPCLVRLD